jgi:DNA-binding NarL/FixJ family response regulator
VSKTIRLMIVDDNAHTRGALAAYVSGLDGVKLVSEALDGQDALEKCEASTPDVVLMDCQMPRLSGLEATRIIKGRWPNTRVVALTLHPECDLEAGQAGADIVLMKGCTAAELVSAIRTMGDR